MALTSGNISTYNSNPSGSNPISWSHTQNTGSNGVLIVVLAVPATTVSSVTYAGAAMTLVRQESTSYSTAWSVWKKVGPATGSNSISVTFASGPWNQISGVAYSFTGCSGVGATAFNNSQTTNKCSTSLTISANSMILGLAIGGTGTQGMEIPDGTARTTNYSHQINNWTWGAISPALTSGSKTVSSTCSASSSIVMAIEIQEASSSTTPTVTTTAISNITRLTADSGGNVTSDGGASVTARGVCWNTTGTPTTSDTKTSNGTGTGSFTSNLTGLSPGKIYYVRAYATNSVGTSYGSQVNFTTLRRIIVI